MLGCDLFMDFRNCSWIFGEIELTGPSKQGVDFVRISDQISENIVSTPLDDNDFLKSDWVNPFSEKPPKRFQDKSF